MPGSCQSGQKNSSEECVLSRHATIRRSTHFQRSSRKSRTHRSYTPVDATATDEPIDRSRVFCPSRIRSSICSPIRSASSPTPRLLAPVASAQGIAEGRQRSPEEHLVLAGLVRSADPLLAQHRLHDLQASRFRLRGSRRHRGGGALLSSAVTPQGVVMRSGGQLSTYVKTPSPSRHLRWP